MNHAFWCEAKDESGAVLHAPDCERQQCYVVRAKKQEVNTGSKEKMPEHYRCTITCACCGGPKHYDDGCYDKHRLSANWQGETNTRGSHNRRQW